MSQNGQPRRLLVEHFCETNVGCSFLSRQSRFPDLESKRQTILSTMQRGQKWPGSEPVPCFGVMVKADFSAVRGLRSFAQPLRRKTRHGGKGVSLIDTPAWAGIRHRPYCSKMSESAYPPKMEDRFCFSDLGSERIPITQNCAKGCASRYAQNYAHLWSALKIQF